MEDKLGIFWFQVLVILVVFNYVPWMIERVSQMDKYDSSLCNICCYGNSWQVNDFKS